ncbi:hypothetical protein MKX01_012182 [Papaver californicum]|nr:hypothetical protein MKX01_012182 [Papaver californicum]
MMTTTARPTTTLAFGSSTDTKQPSSSLSFNNHHLIKTRSCSSSAISPQTHIFPSQEQKKEAVKEITSRRDVIRIGLYLTAAALFSQNSEAAELASTIEYTVTPLGLGFYDKVIGIGPQPTKGQLIKVIKGWDQGILGGDGIPPMLPGTNCIILPNSTLLFDVEFIGKA